MSKIRMDPDNLFPWPKGAFIGNKKSGAVYINISNAYVKPENKKKAPGTRGYTGHRTKCIGKVADPSAREHAFFYANDAYRRDFLHLDVPELPDPPRLNDSVTAGLHVWISEASAASGLRRDLAEAFGEDDAREILDLAQYMISGKSALMEHYSAWGRDHMIFSSEILDCAEIGSFLKKRLTRSRIRKFQLKWAERSLSGSEDAVLLCSDAVHENGQAQGADLVKEDPPLEDPFLSFSHTDYAIRQSDGMPVAYLHAPGPLPELREAQEIVGLLGECKSKPDDKIRAFMIIDRGALSEKCLRRMEAEGIDYILALSESDGLSKKLADHWDLWADEVKSLAQKLETDPDTDPERDGEEERYGLTVPCQILEGKEPHDVHIIWREGLGQPDQPGQESQTGGPGQQNHSACSRSDRSASLDEMSRVISMHFCTLFSEGAGAEVAKAHKRRDQGRERGIRILISSREMTAHEAAESLRKCIPAKIAFEAMRSHPGKDGIGISPEEAMTGKEFIWFVTSILYALLLCGTEPLRTSDRKGFSLPEIVDDLEAVKADRNIRKNKYERRYRLTKRQAEILSCFDISEERLDEIIDLLNED